jgi:hypothetical protein
VSGALPIEFGKLLAMSKYSNRKNWQTSASPCISNILPL